MRSILSIILIGMANAGRITRDFPSVIEENLGLIDRVVAYVARTHGLSPDDRDELGSRVKLKLVDRDYEVLRAYEGRASLKSYLITVAQSVCLDYRNQLWGKWRPSKVAQRLGPLAIRLERAIHRDGQTQSEAISHLLHDPSVDEDEQSLILLANQLPHRAPRRFLEEEELEHMPDTDPCAEQSMMARQKAATLHTLEGSLHQALTQNSSEEQLIVKMHYHEGLKISQISRLLGLDQKKLYRRLDKLLAGLRTHLEAQGYKQSTILELLGD